MVCPHTAVCVCARVLYLDLALTGLPLFRGSFTETDSPQERPSQTTAEQPSRTEGKSFRSVSD